MDQTLTINILSFASETVVVMAIVVLILKNYLSFHKTSKIVYFFTCLGYFFSIAILFLMPVDLGVTNYRSCLMDNSENISHILTESDYCNKPFNYIEPDVLAIIWSVVYWTTYVCTWLVYPLLQSYVVSGEFTVKGKLWAAVKENLIFYGIGAVFMIIIFITLSVLLSGLAKAWDVAQIAGNLWGLFVLIALLGYGLVFIPRTLWRRANRKLAMKYCLFNLCGYSDDIETHRVALDDTMKLIKAYDDGIKEDHELRHCIDEILKHTPKEYNHLKRGEGEIKTTRQDLVALHCKLFQDVHQYTTAICLFEETYKQSVYLEDTIRERSEGCKWKSHHSGYLGKIRDALDWFWSLISPVVFRVVSVLCGIMSFALVWSEVVFPFPPVRFLSAYAFTLSLFEEYNLALQFFAFALISYSGMCCYTALFKFKLFNYYRLLPHQMTDQYSILFSAAYLSRLVAPLCLNFLHVTNFNAKSFPSPFLGTMQSDPIQSAAYSYFPIILVIFCFVNVFNLGNKVMSLCKFRTFQYTEGYDDDHISRGRDILDRERTARERGSTLVRGLAQENTAPKIPKGAAEPEPNVPLEKDDEDSLDREGREFDTDTDSQVEFDSRIELEEKPEPSVGEKVFSFFKSFVKTTPKKDDSKSELLNGSSPSTSQEQELESSDVIINLHQRLATNKAPKSSKPKEKKKKKKGGKRTVWDDDSEEETTLPKNKKQFDFL